MNYKKGKLIFKTKYCMTMLMTRSHANIEFQLHTSLLFFIIFLFNF